MHHASQQPDVQRWITHVLMVHLLAEKPSFGTFLSEWKALYDSGSGERGLFSRAAAQRQAARNGRRDATQPFGTNPCW